MNPVCRLYKRALRCSHDWIVDRIEWRVYALAIRAAFDRRKDEQDPAKVAHFIKLTEELLTYWKHDVPYIYPLSEDGAMAGREVEFGQEALEWGHRKIWGENWQQEMVKYETGLLHNKRQTYYNTPVIDYTKEK